MGPVVKPEQKPGTIRAGFMLGMAGYRVLTLEALKSGTATFRAANARS